MKRILTGIISIIMIAALCSGCTDGTADLSSVSEDSGQAKSSTEPASVDSSLRLGSIMESYAICYCNDGLKYSQTSGNVFVPHN